MPKPRRRRRFFALEGRIDVGDSGEPEGVVDPSRVDPTVEKGVSARKGDTEGAGFQHPASPTESSMGDSLPPAFQLNRAPRPRPARKPLISWLALLLSTAVLGVGIIVGYLLARNGVSPVVGNAPGNAQKEGEPLSPADESDLDAAYAARHSHAYDEAERIFTALERRHPDWGAIRVELGRTLFYANKSPDASAVLKAAVEKGRKPSEAYFLLGVLNKSRGSYPEAERCFAKAVAVDPTEPEHYFFWGECLREQGKLLEAAAKFRSALLRNQYETATSLYRAKLWLCAIEAEQEGTDIDPQINAALAEPRPPMEAFVAAAARDLKAGDYAAAAVHLSRARRRADATVFHYIIADPVFIPARSRPGLMDFFRNAPPAQVEVPNASASSPEAGATPAASPGKE